MRRATALAVPVRMQAVFHYLQPFLRNALSMCALQPSVAKTLKPLFCGFNVIQGH